MKPNLKPKQLKPTLKPSGQKSATFNKKPGRLNKDIIIDEIPEDKEM